MEGLIDEQQAAVAGFCEQTQQLQDRLGHCIEARDYSQAQKIESQLQEVKQQHERQALEVGSIP